MSSDEPLTVRATIPTNDDSGEIHPKGAPVGVAIAVPTLTIGQIIDDYEILRLLGSGGFAQVFLARQVSLNRLVALKASANQGTEARTLARLEHQHIVQVFAEIVLAEQNLRLMSIQFIPGLTLAQIMHAQGEYSIPKRNGRNFLHILDQHCTEMTTLDLGGLEVRAFLEGCNHVELTCWLGARLAEALAHAHSQGVIHLDIKPANVLVNRYGRPYLADFNVARDDSVKPGKIGGTLSYMSPEQLDRVLSRVDGMQVVIDFRSDLYSLAVVLFEFLVGSGLFPRKLDSSNRMESLRQMQQELHAPPPSAKTRWPKTPEIMDRVIRRCLDPEPEKRFDSAAHLVRALDGCRDLLQIEKEPGQKSRLVQICRAYPFRMLTILAILPHVIGSVVNILYNQQLIVAAEPAQHAAFNRIVLAYNTIIYPVLVLAAIIVIRRVWLGWQLLRAQPDISAEETTRIRRQALTLTQWLVPISCLGWFPGGIIFPLFIHLEAGPLPSGDFVHFLISFILSGLIATTYHYFAVQFVVLRVLYPQMWSDPSAARETMLIEFRGLPAQLRLFQFIAVLIPLFGAALLIGAGPDRLTIAFRVLVTALIILGLAGFALATRMCNSLTQVLALLTGRR